MRTLGVICARTKSVRVPRKSWQEIGGWTLLERAIQAAMESERLTQYVVATDEEFEIQPDYPYIWLHDELADGPIIDTLQWVLECWPPPIDAVVTLQACIPFRTGIHIDQTIEMLEHCHLDSTQTVVNVGWEAAPIWKPNGAVYATRTEWIRRGKIIGPRHGCVVMQPEESVNIDTEWDLRVARALCASSS